MLLSESKAKQTSADSFLPTNSYSNKNQAQSCGECGMAFDTIPQLLNHRRRFCQNSGYDNLTGLLMKETGRNDLKVDYKLHKGQGIKRNNDTNKMKSYGQYSLGKIKYDSVLEEVANKRSLMLYDDMMGLQKHKNELQFVRHYGMRSKFFQSGSSNKGPDAKYLSEKRQAQEFGNSKSVSAFEYRLNENNFSDTKPANNAEYLQSLLLKNQSPVSPATNSLVRDRVKIPRKQFLEDEQQNSNIVHYKTNLASLQFQESLKKPTLLNRSNASIADMPPQQKLTYAKYKLDELHQIKELYLKNGGQSKQFKENVEKMIGFYERLVEDCQAKNMEGSRLSVASRPETPIMKLDGLSKNGQKIHEGNKNSGKQNIVHSARGDMNQNLPQNSNLNQLGPNQFPFQLPSTSMNPYSPHFPQHDPNSLLAHNYAQMYQMKMMEEMLKSKSEENRKLIEALISGISKEKYSEVKNVTEAQKEEQERYRFANEVNTSKSSEDRILKLLQEEQLDEMVLLSKLPVGLQDQKLQSLIKNSELRFKMEKQVLRQKLERLSWQEKVQSIEEERQLKNNDWVGAKNKDVIKSQINQYMQDFQEEFRPYQ